jgi:amylosucrase
MYNHHVHQLLNRKLKEHTFDLTGHDNAFYQRAVANIEPIHRLYHEIYASHPEAAAVFIGVIGEILSAYTFRSEPMKERDIEKLNQGGWFLSNTIHGMSLYVDRFCGRLQNLPDKLPYLNELGVNFLHLMPIFESPEGESDGGYAVSDFRKVDSRFGTLDDLMALRKAMDEKGMYLMLDIVLNHTSHRHEWAEKAKAGDKFYQSFFYMYDDRKIPDEFEKTMPEIFPEAAPGSFTYDENTRKWVMTVFHHYQWDLNFTNPFVFKEMLGNIFFFANLGVDVLRIDAPPFIWKQVGTTCQNLPQVHTILQLIKLCVEVAAPGMAILGEAIVAPKEIMKYFGSGIYTAHECDFAYHATQMALQWDMLATTDTRVMLAAQQEISQKPFGTSWITYTRCHDDIGLAYDDYMIEQAGYNPYQHRKFLKEYFSGVYESSPAKGALFSSNPKTGDARISGSLASLCGLEKAIETGNHSAIRASISKILLMQAHSFFLGGVPMIFYGDEVGYTNDYSYLNDPGKSYDNRWMHRPIIDWKKNEGRFSDGTIESIVFNATKKLLALRSSLPAIADVKNLIWLDTQNRHVAGYLRYTQQQKVFCLFNFSPQEVALSTHFFLEHGASPSALFNHWTGQRLTFKKNLEELAIDGYEFMILEQK